VSVGAQLVQQKSSSFFFLRGAFLVPANLGVVSIYIIYSCCFDLTMSYIIYLTFFSLHHLWIPSAVCIFWAGAHTILHFWSL
jgi:hypothetical protein